MTAKSVAERVAALRQRREALGLTRLELYVHPDDHQAIKKTAAGLIRKREKEGGMKNKREAEPDFFDMVVDVKTWSTVSASERVRPCQCRVTPKRVYTPGGATFSRETGHELIARKHLYGSTYKRRALMETLRPATQAVT